MILKEIYKPIFYNKNKQEIKIRRAAAEAQNFAHFLPISEPKLCTQIRCDCVAFFLGRHRRRANPPFPTTPTVTAALPFSVCKKAVGRAGAHGGKIRAAQPLSKPHFSGQFCPSLQNQPNRQKPQIAARASRKPVDCI